MKPTIDILSEEIFSKHKAIAWVDDDTPCQRTKQKVYGHIINNDDSQTKTKMYCKVLYKTKKSRLPCKGYIESDNNGLVSLDFNIGSAAKDYAVLIIVYLLYKDKEYVTFTSFIPQ